jgi:predicted nucleic acid-binding protein
LIKLFARYVKGHAPKGSVLTEILLDSDVIIAWLRGHEPFSELIPELLAKGTQLFWTPVSVAEIFAGVRKSEEQQVANLFLILESLSLSSETGRKAGYYLQAYAKSHNVELGDALIAASSCLNDITLWTLNKKHYPMRDIRFYSPPP